ncbi:sensor histidine kinase [Afifella pfennigii]|uniref:sensor histidine kinase n=1 Tax=Afifella pfennigii TaxID=209897 RepID=UPI001FE1119C|nr:HWE histidine kinase domain-containing protein [Afifella pfennigii]
MRRLKSVLAPSVARLAALVGLVGALTVLAAVSLLAFEQWRELSQKTEDATRSAAFFLADHAARLFEVSDLALEKAAVASQSMSWEEVETSRGLYDELAAVRADLPYVDDLWLNDTDGKLRLTTFAFPAPASQASDRDAFRAHLQPGGALYVGMPIVGRVTERATFLVSRRLEEADGSFRGVAFATLDLAYFHSFWERIPLPPQALVTLFRRSDQAVLARHPHAALTDLPGFSEELEALLAAGPGEGRFTQLAQNGETRFGAYHQVGALPVYVRVSVPTHALVSLWLGNAWPYGVFALAAILSLLGLTAYARHEARRDAASRDFLQQEVARRTAALEEETQALEALNGASRILSAELDPDRAVRAVVDAGVVLTGAECAAFLGADAAGEAEGAAAAALQAFYVRPGASAEAFRRFLQERQAQLLAMQGIRRSANLHEEDGDPGGKAASAGPRIHSLLAVPVASRSGKNLGRLIFLHSRTAVFSARSERLILGLAAQAAIAIDNAHLFTAAQAEIAARKATQKRQELLIRELHHRVKNTLAIVQAIAGLTARSVEDVAAFNEAFSGRLASLAATHTLLTEWSWEKAPLKDLLREQLEPYAGDYVLEGPDIELSATQAVPIGMAMHELATNAAKHGALSKPEGRVTVRWHLQAPADEVRAPTLLLEWQERGGPPAAPPERQGFGSRLLAEVLKVQLQAKTHVVYGEEGLTFRLEASLGAAEADDADRSGQPARPAQASEDAAVATQ